MNPKLTDVSPDLLTTIGASAMHALISAGWVGSRAPGKPVYTRAAPDPLPEVPRKPYQSRYVGVSRRYSGWRGNWAVDGRYVCGPTREMEIEAARDRADAMGRDYLEVRDAT